MKAYRHSCGSLKRSLGTVTVVMVLIATTSGVTSASSTAGDVLLGYFGPATTDHPQGGDLWCAASLALEEANEAGDYQGRPFRFITSWSANP